MSLLQDMSYPEYKKALEFSLEKCQVIAKLANLKITYTKDKKPGEVLVKTLDRFGIRAAEYNDLVDKSSNVRIISTYYKPQSKVAVLIVNDKYLHLSHLGTPNSDSDSVAKYLIHMGFIVLKIKNTVSANLKVILTKICDVLLKDSYCFIFYAGHGFRLSNIKCMPGIDCPQEDIKMEHCVTENFVLKEFQRSDPDLCVLVMDMCRKYLDRVANPQIYAALSTVEEYEFERNRLISYSAQSSQAAYEVLELQCSTTIVEDLTYELKTGDTGRIVGGSSQYVKALCKRFNEDLDISSLFDKVHEDVENSLKKQQPIKVQHGTAKRSLYDPTTGDVSALKELLKEQIKDYEEYCVVL